MQANIIGASLTVFVTVVVSVTLVYWLRKYLERNADLSSAMHEPATTYVAGMLQNRGLTECEMLHTRAGSSHLFFDTDQWLSDSSNLQVATSWIVKTILEVKSKANQDGLPIEGLAFIEKDSGPTGLISLQHLIASKTGMKSCVIRLRRWPFLPQAAIKGEPPQKGTRWILISDVATTGGHLMKAAKVLGHSCWGASAPFAIVLMNRDDESVVERLECSGTEILSNAEIKEMFLERLDEVEKRAA